MMASVAVGIASCSRAHQRTLAACAHKGDDLADQRVVGKFDRQRLDALGKPPFSEKQLSIGAAQPMHVGPRRTAPAQPDHIQSDQRAGLAEREAKRNNIIARRRHAGHHYALADPHELMDRDVATEKRVIADADMTAEHHVIGQSDVVADHAIVSDVSADHEQAARANPRDAAAGFGPGIHRNTFAQFAGRADHEPGFAAAIMDRLRRRSERAERVNARPLADRGCAGDVDMSDEPYPALELDLRADQTIGSNLNGGANARAFGHARRWIDRHLSLGDDGADLGLGDQDIADFGLGAIPPHVAAARDLVDMIGECVAGHSGFAKFGLVDGEKVEHRIFPGGLVHLA
jgi:hypothetical protein